MPKVEGRTQFTMVVEEVQRKDTVRGWHDYVDRITFRYVENKDGPSVKPDQAREERTIRAYHGADRPIWMWYRIENRAVEPAIGGTVVTYEINYGYDSGD